MEQFTDGDDSRGEAPASGHEFTSTLQIGIVVRELDAAIERYSEIGIRPWQVFELEPDDVTSWSEYGQPVRRSSRFAVATVGEVYWELIEPVDDDSLHARFLAENGEGVQHIAVGVRDYDATMAEHDSQGRTPILTAEVGGIRVSYLDTAAELGVVLEVADLPDATDGSASSTPERTEPVVTPSGIAGTLQIGIVVRNLDAVMRQYEEWGIGPWDTQEFGPDQYTHLEEYGERVERRWRLALANIGSVQWELIEPLDDTGIYATFLAERGEGVQHLGVDVPDLDATLGAHAEHGGAVALSGSAGGSRVAYLDTRDTLGVMVEIFDLADDARAAQRKP